MGVGGGDRVWERKGEGRGGAPKEGPWEFPNSQVAYM